MTIPYIEADRVRKIYNPGPDAVEALSSISFTIEPGEFVSILGPSGCGKSTLLMMVGGLESPSAGSLLVAGRPVENPRTDIGIIFQDPTLLPWKTALDNVLFPIHILKRSLHAFSKDFRIAEWLPFGLNPDDAGEYALIEQRQGI